MRVPDRVARAPLGALFRPNVLDRIPDVADRIAEGTAFPRDRTVTLAERADPARRAASAADTSHLGVDSRRKGASYELEASRHRFARRDEMTATMKKAAFALVLALVALEAAVRVRFFLAHDRDP